MTRAVRRRHRHGLLLPAFWWPAARLALGVAVALGLARFGYGLLVPAMRAELGWSLTQAGATTTANALGYLAGAAATPLITRRLTPTVTFRAGMALTAVSLAATAASTSYPFLLAMRATAGLAGALVFVTGGVLAARIAAGAGSATPVTVYFSGAGLGIALCGAAIPPLLEHAPNRWPWAWAGMATAAALATAATWTAAQTPDRPDTTQARHGRRHLRPLRRVAAAYTLFGAGYIAYLTFLSAYLTDQHAATGLVTLTWVLLGLGVVAAPVVWNRPIATWPGTRALAMLLAVLAAAAALPLLHPALPVILVSAVAYGAAFMGVPTAVTTLVRATIPATDWTPTLAALTVLFAAGQTAGPWLAGILADHTTTDATLTWTAALCATAAALTRTGRTPP